MPGGKGNIKPEDGKQFSSTYQPQKKWMGKEGEKRALKIAEELIEWMKAVDDDGVDRGNIFFDEFLVIEKDLYPSLIDYLCDKHTSFSKLIEKAKKIQEIKLKKYGVGDRLNASMTKFTLINNHDWKDKSETDHTTKGKEINRLQIEYVNAGK